jgi:gluconolactonase
MWTPPTSRYPDPAVQVLDDSFAKLRLRTASVERLATGFRWAEGPVWFGDQRCLLWSDIPNNQILRWDEQTGAVSIFRKPSNHANGNTRDRQGRLVTCEHETRRITRTEYDGSITVLADRFEGKRFNSPNDIVVKSDGSIWFTDPIFGVNSNYESRKGTSELPQHVYRLDPETGDLAVAIEGLKGPNGLAFSPDESKLYVVESLAAPNRLIHVCDVSGGGKMLTNRKVLIDCGAGTSDGLRVDTAGNLWCGWGMGSDDLDGVMVFNADGKPIGRIALPERCANLCFGGEMRNRLFMASSQSLYALYVDAQGATLS